MKQRTRRALEAIAFADKAKTATYCREIGLDEAIVKTIEGTASSEATRKHRKDALIYAFREIAVRALTESGD